MCQVAVKPYQITARMGIFLRSLAKLFFRFKIGLFLPLNRGLMCRLFFLLILSSFTMTVSATDWEELSKDRIFLDKDSVIKLYNPLRVTFDTKYVRPDLNIYVVMNWGLKCHSGKQYLNRARVYSLSTDRFLRKFTAIELNKDEDVRSGMFYDLYTIYCRK